MFVSVTGLDLGVEEMKLLPREIEKLELHQAGFLAQKRLARGIRLNYTESVALIATQVLLSTILRFFEYVSIHKLMVVLMDV